MQTSALIVWVALAACPGFAQVNATGTLLGTVTDPSGAVVPGALVKATSQETELLRETTTSGIGQYRVDLLPAGMYLLRVTSKGFAEQVSGDSGGTRPGSAFRQGRRIPD